MHHTKHVRDIMSTQVDTVGPDVRMEELSAHFEGEGHYHLPVVDEEKDEIVGMVSRTDYLRLQHSLTQFDTPEAKVANMKLFHSMLVRDVMNTPVVTIAPDLTLKEVADQFRHKNYHCLPVVEDRKLVGIVTVMDLLHHAYNDA